MRLWSTFNEPGVMGFCGWIYGAFPPAKLGAFREAGEHLWNLMQAHKAAYRAIKALPGGHAVTEKAAALCRSKQQPSYHTQLLLAAVSSSPAQQRS